MENGENKPQSYAERVKKFGNTLISEGLAVEVSSGLEIDATDYEYLSGDQFTIDNTKNVICKFLALPMYIDNFASHPERIEAFNTAGTAGRLPSDFRELYFHNKLRTNRLAPVLDVIKTTAKVRQISPELKTFFSEQIQSINLDNYQDLTTDQKIKVVSAIEGIAIKCLNKMIELGLISGPQVSA